MSLIAWFQFICNGFGRSRLCQSVRIYSLYFEEKKTAGLKNTGFFWKSSTLPDVSINSRNKFNFAIYRYQFRSSYPVVHPSLLHRFNLRINVLLTHAPAFKKGNPHYFQLLYINDNLEHSGDTIVSRWENVTISQYTSGLKYWTPVQSMVT